MAPADWSERDKEIIDSRYRIWKTANKPASRKNVVAATSLRCGDIHGDTEAWFASHWDVQIGRYYASREAQEDGRPILQAKTKEQIALLDFAFSETSGYPYTGEVLALAFLSGLQVKQVKTWFENQRRKCVKDENYLALEKPELLGMRGQDTKDAAAMVRAYNKDPREYARSLVMWERCVRTGQPGASEHLQYPRPYFKKYWNRMFPEDGDERSLLEAVEELDDSDDDSIANLTREEIDDMLKQSQVESRQSRMNRAELEAEAEAEAQAGSSAQPIILSEI